MELARHDATIPYGAIASTSTFHTQDVEEARQWGVRTFCESRQTTIGGQRPIDAQLNLRRVRGVGFGRMTYGGEVRVEATGFESLSRGSRKGHLSVKRTVSQLHFPVRWHQRLEHR